MNNKEPEGMSDAERRMADYVAEQAAQITVARLLDALRDDSFADDMVKTWGGAFDRTLGRGLRRFVFYILLAVVAMAGAKMGLWDKFLSLMKP